jgi:hypothetical protein
MESAMEARRDGRTCSVIARPAAPRDRTVFYLSDEEAAVILRMRKAVQAQRKLNRKRSTTDEGSDHA